MHRLLKFLIADQRRAKLERLAVLAAQMDRILKMDALSPATREVIQGRRERLEDQIHELLAA